MAAPPPNAKPTLMGGTCTTGAVVAGTLGAGLLAQAASRVHSTLLERVLAEIRMGRKLNAQIRNRSSTLD